MNKNKVPKEATINFSSKKVKKYHLINVDSRMRDHNKYSNPHQYKLKLKRVYRNVSKIELVTAEIPRTDFLINEYNNKLDVIDDGNTVTVTITVGDYTPAELASEIETQLNALGYSTWTISFSNGKYTFISTNNFSFLFETGTNADVIKTTNDNYNIGYMIDGTSIRKVLGFPISDTTSGMSITSTNKVNLIGPGYLILELGSIMKENMDWYDDTGSSAFGKIVFTSDINDITSYNEHLYDISRTYNPPLKKLENLDIKFKVYGGNYYNFRGHEHSFMLRLTTLE